MRALVSIALLFVFAGCGFGVGGQMKAPCDSDDQCAEGQVCFPDGCGDPARDLSVEVTPNIQAGYLPQDFALPELGTTLNLDVRGPSSIAGVVLREVPSITPSPVVPYSEAQMTFTITGESVVIPGVRRSFSATVTPSKTDGSYSVPVAAGAFAITAVSADTSIPPVQAQALDVNPGETATANFTLWASSDLFRVDGRLVRTGTIPIQATQMTVQALDVNTKKPLSQVVPASSGQLGSTGDFTLWLSPEVVKSGAKNFLVVATPRDPAANVPSKTFTVMVENTLKSALEMGDYGSPVQITGTVNGEDNTPLVGATVYVDGTVNGDGTYKSVKVVTDEGGKFALTTLPSKTNGSGFNLWIIPDAKSRSGILKVPLTVTTAADVGVFTCPAKPIVSGTVFRYTGVGASAVRIVAEPLSAIDGEPLPAASSTVTTDDAGNFQIALSPAWYRMDFIPSDPSDPRTSRIVPVHSAKLEPQASVGMTTLSRARKVSGSITSQGSTKLPYAGIRIFRTVMIEGKKSSVLLAEGLADSNGTFEVVLPAGKVSVAQ